MDNSTKRKSKIVILGYGWVGQANALALSRMGHQVFYYDVVTPQKYYPEYGIIYEKIKPLTSPFEQESPNTWYLVCVGDRVSEDGIQDVSLISSALQSVKHAKGRVVLRSTVLPDLLKNLEFDYYLPEFLHELKAVEECLNPFYFVVGCRAAKQGLPIFLREWQARANKIFEGSPEQASYIKYLSNTWNAVRVAFVNEFGDIVTNLNAGEVKGAEEIINFVLERGNYLRYGKPFGGHCLPKDLRSFARKYAGGQNAVLLKAALDSNLMHAETEKKYGELPNWFSFWEYDSSKIENPKLMPIIWRKLNRLKVVKSARAKVKPFFNKIIKPKSLSESMAMWNKLGLQNARYFTNIGTQSGRNVDEFEVKETGRADYEKYIKSDELLNEKLGNFKEKIMLEIGCGIGRMTEVFANNFQEVYAVDFSDVMIGCAQKRLAAYNNAVLAVNDGAKIPFADNAFDFIFSFLVFRYITARKTVEDYFKEVYRTLKPGGLAKIELRTGPNIRKWQWSYGISLDPDSTLAIAQNAGLKVAKYLVEGSRNSWIWVEKSR